jgi:hypothetical protein
MIEGLMPGKSHLFILKTISAHGKDSFHIQSQNNKIFIEGTNAFSMQKDLIKLLSKKLSPFNCFLV